MQRIASVNFCPYMNPFSWLAFSNFFLIIGPSFRKKGCCHGRAVVPGPLVLEYSREIASAFLYTANETKKDRFRLKLKNYNANKCSLYSSQILSISTFIHSFVGLFHRSVSPSMRQSASHSVSPSVREFVRTPVRRSVSHSNTSLCLSAIKSLHGFIFSTRINTLLSNLFSGVLSQVAHHHAGAYPGFCSMMQPGIFLLLPGWDASPSQGYPQH